MRFVAKRNILQQKCLKGQNRNMPVWNTMVQFFARYTNPESQNAQRHRHTDRQTDRQTDRETDGRTDRQTTGLCVAVQSAKNSAWYHYLNLRCVSLP